MHSNVARPRCTVEDFMRLPEGVLAELIDGEILVSPSPRSRHQEVAFNLAACLREFVKCRGLGKVFVAPMDVHLPTGDIVEPDVLFIASANLSIIQDWIRGVPDLVVEVLSPDGIARDRLVKRGLYARNGVPEFWIVDPEESTIEVLSCRGHQYEPAGYFQAGDELRSTLLPGLDLPVSAVFE